MINNARTGIAFALLAALSYGFVPALARIAYAHGAPVLHTVVLRTAVLAIVLGVVAFVAKQSFRIPKAARKGFLLQLLATGGVSIFYLISVQYIPVALSVIIFFTFPVIILVATPIVEGVAPPLSRVAIALLAFIGLAIAAGPQFETLDPRGILFACLGAACCALQFFAGRLSSRFLDPAVYASLVHATILPVILLASYLVTKQHFVFLTGEGVTAKAYFAALGLSTCYVVAFFLHMNSLRYATPATVAPFFNLEPIVTTAAAVFIVGEKPGANHYLGGAIVLASLAACAMLEARNQRDPLA